MALLVRMPNVVSIKFWAFVLFCKIFDQVDDFYFIFSQNVCDLLMYIFQRVVLKPIVALLKNGHEDYLKTGPFSFQKLMYFRKIVKCRSLISLKIMPVIFLLR
jgi:hypothetical protein